ncbi:MAG TPA: VWA domain-containing protein [Blastocatellia bacterium]|nr:VWA domain-containing protein [Blastocatellia bacterium]
MKASVPERRSNVLARVVFVNPSRLSLVAFLVLFLSHSAGAQQAPGPRVETFVLGPNGSVRLENQRGSSRVEVWDKQSVRVVVEKKQPSSTPLMPSDLVLMGAGSNLLIQCKQNGSPDRIDIAVYVPRASHLQITGGTWPVEVKGSLASAVVDTTTGNIGYKLPPSDDIRVAMHSARGIVRSDVSLNVSDRSGTHGLQGSLGSGIAPIILNSQGGNITLLPAADAVGARRVVDENRIRSLGVDDARDIQSRDRSSESEQVGRDQQGRDQTYARQDQRQRASQPGNSPDPDDPEQNASGGFPAQQPRSYSPPASGGNSAVFAGGTNSSASSSVTKNGPLTRPRTQTDSGENSSGLGVRIIPSNPTLSPTPSPGPARDPRYSNRPPAVGNPPDDLDKDMPPLDPDNPGKDPHSSSSSSQGTSSSYPSGGSGSAVFAGGTGSKANSSVTKYGPLTRPRTETDSNENSSGLSVRIIPSNATLGSVPDPRYSGGQSTGSGGYDQQQNQSAQAQGQGRGNARSSSKSSQYDDPNPAGRADARDSSRDDSIAYTAPSPASSRPGPPSLNRSTAAGGADPESRAGGAGHDEESVVLNSSLVNVNVSVTDRAGKSLANLKKEDFRVFENGEPQKLEFFAPTNAPFNLVLLLDLSGSIYDKADVVKSAALHFLDALGPQDRVAVITFTRTVAVLSPLTKDHELLRMLIKSIQRPEGGTAFYEALWFALTETLRGTQGQRNAIVVMSDGVDNSLDRFNPAHSRISFGQLAGRLEESDCIVFPVYLDTEFEEVFERGNTTAEAYAISRDQLQRIADLTGGQIFTAKQARDLTGVYNQVAASLRTVYSVGYYPTHSERDGTYRRVRVQVGRPDVAVRARKGYYAK